MSFTKQNRNQRQRKDNQLQLDTLKVHLQFFPEHEGLIHSCPPNANGEDLKMLDNARIGSLLNSPYQLMKAQMISLSTSA